MSVTFDFYILYVCSGAVFKLIVAHVHHVCGFTQIERADKVVPVAHKLVPAVHVPEQGIVCCRSVDLRCHGKSPLVATEVNHPAGERGGLGSRFKGNEIQLVVSGYVSHGVMPMG